MTAHDPGCHAGLPAELRALVTAALDRIEPVLERVRSEPPTPPESGSCTVCPVCAVIAVLRGERPETAVRLAEQVAGLVTLLRTALEAGTDDVPEPAAPTTPSGRTVQRIPVERVGARR